MDTITNTIKLSKLIETIEVAWSKTYSTGSMMAFNDYLNSISEIKSFQWKYVVGSSVMLAYTVVNIDQVQLVELGY